MQFNWPDDFEASQCDMRTLPSHDERSVLHRLQNAKKSFKEMSIKGLRKAAIGVIAH
jgi:phage-related protein